MLYYIRYGCTCEDVEAVMEFSSEQEAIDYVYQSAHDSYHSFEGFYGIRDLSDIAEDLFEKDLDDCTESELSEIEEEFEEEIENDIYYFIELFDEENEDHLLCLEE